MAEDYYAVLAVARDATTQDIKRAFREIARRCHPDVAGGDPTSEEQFKNARKAYETLMDPVARARYDRRGQRQAPPPGGSFFDAFYKATGRAQETRQETTVTGRMKTGRPTTGGRNPGNDVTLDDLFNDFGFGEGRVTGRHPSSDAHPGGKAREPGPKPGRPEQGDEVHVDLEVAEKIARDGGSTTAVYYRMQRADSWRPGAADAGLVRVQDIADIRIVPGTRDGEILRERGLGNAGSHGGAYGDLVVTVRIVASRRSEPGQEPGPTIDLGIVEALLGGRVALETPQGRIWLTIPPGTSSGVQLRLKGKGPVGADGVAADWFVTTRIVVPKGLDAESRRLIEEFARLNPSSE
jgi:DnaJ-class molecular chaperone